MLLVYISICDLALFCFYTREVMGGGGGGGMEEEREKDE